MKQEETWIIAMRLLGPRWKSATRRTAYKAARVSVGPWKSVAPMLGINWRTIARREAGDVQITNEAALAMFFLAGRAAGAGVGLKRRTKKGKAPNKDYTTPVV